MNEKLQNALIELESSLKDIDSAVKMLEETKGSAKAVLVKSVELITDVRDSHDKFVNSLENWYSQLDQSTRVLFHNYEDVWKNHNKNVEDLIAEYKELSSKTGELVKYLNSVNFPARLDKIDSTIASISTSIQNLSGQLIDVKRDITDKMVDQIAKINEKIDKYEAANKTRFIITSIGLALIILALLYTYIT